MTQEEIFSKWNNISEKFSFCKSFVQNDYNALVQDGYFSKEDVKQALISFNESYFRLLNDLKDLKLETEKIMTGAL